MSLAIVILAAGKGTRMESDLAKVLHPLCGRPLVHWVLDAAQPLQATRTVVVVGHQASKVEVEVRAKYPACEFVLQSPMLGTGHAVQQAEPLLGGFEGEIVVTCGDTPLIQSETLRALVEKRHETGSAATMLVAPMDEPGAYGRVLQDDAGRVSAIVEAKDASPDELKVQTVNAGTYCFEAKALWEQLARVDKNNAQGEYYLTDVIGLLRQNGREVYAAPVSPREISGINTRAQLAEMEALLKSEGACADG